MRLTSFDARDISQGTNILELEVPPALDKVYRTGITFFDDAFGGEGITPSTACLFTGTPGAGKTTMMLQLADSLTRSGHIVLFNTAEESLLQVRKVARRLELKNGFFAGADRKVEDILAHADFLRSQHPEKQLFLIIDSLATMDDGKYTSGHTNSNTAVRVMEMITDYCKSADKCYPVAFVIGHVNKEGDFAGKQQVKHTVDVHAHLFIDMSPRSQTYGERIFEIQKNRFGCNGLSYSLTLGKQGFSDIARAWDTATETRE